MSAALIAWVSWRFLSSSHSTCVLDDMWKLADPNSFQAMTIADKIVGAENKRNRTIESLY
ncbi:hypothetical protein [Moraxella catarrhalis]|uniref:hypothetical protein n=1 Tax=Moraxella catarrhalis TaxID=480 RepID=UPI0011C48EF6|nr:hypothetical protein [Moraxella catarrhalis]